MDRNRQLSLVKGAHRYVFQYQTGQEAEVIAAFAELAEDHATDFDWFDAAVLSHQLGRRLETCLRGPTPNDEAGEGR